MPKIETALFYRLLAGAITPAFSRLNTLSGRGRSGKEIKPLKFAPCRVLFAQMINCIINIFASILDTLKCNFRRFTNCFIFARIDKQNKNPEICPKFAPCRVLSVSGNSLHGQTIWSYQEQNKSYLNSLFFLTLKYKNMIQNFSFCFSQKYANNKCILSTIAKCFNLPTVAGYDPQIDFNLFTVENLAKLKKYLLSCPDICQNTAAQYVAKIRAVLLEQQQRGHLQGVDFKGFSIKQLRSKGIYVDPDRLHELEDYQPKTPLRADKQKSVRVAQLLALISSRTGARASDVIRFTPSNIHNGLLTYVPKKTAETSGKVCVVPVGPKTTAMIEEVTELTKDIDISTDAAEHAFYERYKRSLYHICRELPWDEEVVIFARNKQQVKPFKDCITTHTFRHSFATNMYLDEEVGGDIYAIAQMMGHTSADMTMSYICVPFNEKKMKKVKYFE